ncbi:nitroreductase family deazaflavin-dependent oxidoreductase [Nocardia sp. CA2R105]|uniref:nitroreductase family deazaflavin-dependent oxidoreductase n=1 Tax=Nocardia coffeae TaxID=2873381 RepID=UPI001CA79662|nr:nitroreductase family deazaflavin-dependent oxidoreductase [Nocardia coffeae]MBY8863286.1 nitroreductase family deazaflavin-dependent oxidoreductase [Nocardia coffeae]
MSLSDAATALGARALRTRWVVRAPIRLYRAGFGFLFGSRMIMIEHIGRRSGVPRYVVLEVVDHPAPDRYVIVSGFGRTAQWYRNIAAHPSVRVWVGGRRALPGTATPMTDDESAAALDHYIHEHPRAWKNLRATIERATNAPVDTLPMVSVHVPTR